MRRYKINLKAGINEPLAVSGNFLRVIASGSEFQVQPDTGHRLAGLQSGMAYDHKKQFARLDFLSDVDQQIEVMAGQGRVEDNRTAISGTVDVSNKGSTIQESAATVTGAAASILPASTTRRSVIIQNIDPLNAIYIGGAGVTAGTGLLVVAAGNAVMDNAAQAEFYAVSDGADVEIRILEELN